MIYGLGTAENQLVILRVSQLDPTFLSSTVQIPASLEWQFSKSIVQQIKQLNINSIKNPPNRGG